jgi:hypothetical protein
VVILCPNGADCTRETVGAGWWRHLMRRLRGQTLPRRAEPIDTALVRTSDPRDRSQAARGNGVPLPTLFQQD